MKYLSLRVYPEEQLEQRKKEIVKIAKMYSEREGRKVSQNEARNLLIVETAKRKKI
jgi:hypothetical protein